MTVVLAIAALALIGAVVYFTMIEPSHSDDPEDVTAGQQQRDYEPVADPTATASATTSSKRPIIRRTGAWPKPKIKANKPDDPYEDL